MSKIKRKISRLYRSEIDLDIDRDGFIEFEPAKQVEDGKYLGYPGGSTKPHGVLFGI